MGNCFIKPSTSEGGARYANSLRTQGRVEDTPSPRSESARREQLPISPRRRQPDGRGSGLDSLPNELQQQVGDLLPRTARVALRQASRAFNEAIPRQAERDVMHPMEGVHALLDLGDQHRDDEISFAVDRAVRAAQNLPSSLDKGRLLLAASIAAENLRDEGTKQQHLSAINAALDGMPTAEFQRCHESIAQMLEARATA